MCVYKGFYSNTVGGRKPRYVVGVGIISKRKPKWNCVYVKISIHDGCTLIQPPHNIFKHQAVSRNTNMQTYPN